MLSPQEIYTKVGYHLPKDHGIDLKVLLTGAVAVTERYPEGIFIGPDLNKKRGEAVVIVNGDGVYPFRTFNLALSYFVSRVLKGETL